MKKVLLVFSFKANQTPLQLQIQDSDAQAIFKAFHSSAKPPFWAGYIPEEDFYWSVDTSEVAHVSIYNLEVLKQRQEEAKRQQMQGQPSAPLVVNRPFQNYGGSGNN